MYMILFLLELYRWVDKLELLLFFCSEKNLGFLYDVVDILVDLIKDMIFLVIILNIKLDWGF